MYYLIINNLYLYVYCFKNKEIELNVFQILLKQKFIFSTVMGATYTEFHLYFFSLKKIMQKIVI